MTCELEDAHHSAIVEMYLRIEIGGILDGTATVRGTPQIVTVIDGTEYRDGVVLTGFTYEKRPAR